MNPGLRGSASGTGLPLCRKGALFCFVITTGGAGPPEHEGGNKPKATLGIYATAQATQTATGTFTGSVLRGFQRLRTSRM